ncbi:DUF2997 domain-containing protein [Planctomicrobium sp. SH661]|uniref:DUF2997 domain-containing protein n=1 Tax=Planctomicrobium sp. SH661 TaxID=3448124 RepID=UPI003F5B8295
MTQIRILISKTGQIQLQTRGFSGESCRAASWELEQALGLPLQEQLTGEFYQSMGSQEQMALQHGESPEPGF